LQCLVAAVRPLRVEELAEVLAFDFNAEGIPKLNLAWRWEDQEEAVMSACSSLVIVVKDDEEDSRIVQFSHFSVKEYLMSSRLAESSREVSRYHILLEPAHTILAQACLGVLLRLDEHIDRDKMKDLPLAKYAAEHWVKHARVENVSRHIMEGMKCLFDADKPHFMAWLWVHDGDRDSSMVTRFPEKPEAVPLYYAARFGLRDLAAYLLAEHPEDLDAEGGVEVTPFHASVFDGHFDISSLFIEQLRNIDVQGCYLQTPLLRLVTRDKVRRGDLEFGQRLLDRGADVNARDEDDWTPLYSAALNGRLDFVQLLLDHGAAINPLTDIDQTPLYEASARGHVDVVRLLLERGADPNISDRDGLTPSDATRRREIVQLLSEYGANRTRV
jgi:ankyrin repeat protein